MAQRINLLVKVCRAVQHAHHKGVIHRDIKPSNILVTERDGEPQPKVIDFGIAKAVGQRLTERTLVTQFGQALGTPAYMSPEQADASGLDVDTRTDIYSLGVVLYELLSGRLPVDPAEVGYPHFIADLLISDGEPLRPSKRFSTLDGENRRAIARHRNTEPDHLERILGGDLDWIALKAIDRNRNRRYETANSLAEDLTRYLRHEPVVARPPSTAYRVRKFFRRHTAGVSMAFAFGALLLGSALLALAQATRLAHERDRAEEQAARAVALNAFIEQAMLAPNPFGGLGRNVTMAEVLDSAVTRLERASTDEPYVEASIRSAIGWAYFGLGQYDSAEPLLRRALELRTQEASAAPEEVAESFFRLGKLYEIRAEPDSAETAYKTSLEIRRECCAQSSEAVAQSLVGLAGVLVERGEQATALLAEADSLYSAARVQQGMIAARNLLGVSLYHREDYQEAAEVFRSVVELAQDYYGDHPFVAEVLNNLAAVLEELGQLDAAEEAYREALETSRKVLGEEHDNVTAIMNNLALLLSRTGGHLEAQSLYRSALATDERKLGPEHPFVAVDMFNLANLLCQHDEPAEGEQLVGRATEIFQASLPQGDWRVSNAKQLHGFCLGKLGRFKNAEALLLEGLRGLEAEFGYDHSRTRTTRERLIDLYDGWGRTDKAAELRAGAGPNSEDDPTLQ